MAGYCINSEYKPRHKILTVYFIYVIFIIVILLFCYVIGTLGIEIMASVLFSPLQIANVSILNTVHAWKNAVV